LREDIFRQPAFRMVAYDIIETCGMDLATRMNLDHGLFLPGISRLAFSDSLRGGACELLRLRLACLREICLRLQLFLIVRLAVDNDIGAHEGMADAAEAGAENLKSSGSRRRELEIGLRAG